MPKDSCVTHKQGYYLELRRDYIDLFDGDRCSATLLAFFEFGTNGELARMRLAGESGDPWIKASMPSIFQETMETCSIRTLQDRIDFLESSKIIKVSEKAGRVRSYLLDSAHLSCLLSVGSVLPLPESGNSAGAAKPSAAAAAKPSANLTETDRALNLKEEESITDKESSPVVPTPAPQEEENLNLEDSIETFATNAYMRVRGLRLKLGARSLRDMPTSEKLSAGEERHGQEYFRQCLLGFLALNTAWMRENRWPIGTFLEKPEFYFKHYTPGAPVDEPQQFVRVAATPKKLAAIADAPDPAQSRNWLEEWNRLVPEQPTAPNSKKQLLVTIEAAGEDFRDNFDKICAAARKAIKAKGEDVAWLDLYWVCKYSDGESRPNWWRLLFGNLRHMTGRSGVKSASGPEDWVPGMMPVTEKHEAQYLAWKTARRAAGQHVDPDQFAEEQARAAKGDLPHGV